MNLRLAVVKLLHVRRGTDGHREVNTRMFKHSDGNAPENAYITLIAEKRLNL